MTVLALKSLRAGAQSYCTPLYTRAARRRALGYPGAHAII